MGEKSIQESPAQIPLCSYCAAIESRWKPGANRVETGRTLICLILVIDFIRVTNPLNRTVTPEVASSSLVGPATVKH